MWGILAVVAIIGIDLAWPALEVWWRNLHDYERPVRRPRATTVARSHCRLVPRRAPFHDWAVDDPELVDGHRVAT
jgi:hypothetical protein